MTVQELFQKADLYKILDAYLLIYGYPFKGDDHSIQKKLSGIDNFKQAVYDNCKKLQTCLPVPAEQKTTVFVLAYESAWHDEKGEKIYDAFSVHDDELTEFLKKNEDFDNSDAIHHYGIDMLSLQEIAGCNFADASIQSLGAEVCCAVILSELFWFGFTEETRAENIEETINTLKERIKEIEEHPDQLISGKNLFDELFQEILDECENEDEKKYMILEREFNEKVKGIEQRFTDKIIQKNQQIFMDAIKAEFCLK